MLTKGSVKLLVRLLILQRIVILRTCGTLILSLYQERGVYAASSPIDLGSRTTPQNIQDGSWQEELAQMPLRTSATELNRTNCVQIMLNAFQSNHVVKALVFMPGATDEFYLFRRARAVLTNGNSTLLEAIGALTNQTLIRATFRPPLLLLHTEEDSIEPANSVQDQRTAEGLKRDRRIAHLSCNDRDWDFLEPILKHSLKIALRPWRYSSKSWHFYRHNFAAWDVDGMEALEIAAFAGKSKFTLHRSEAFFEPDPRVRQAPPFDAHLLLR
jgi:hypothetical protein